MHPTELRADVDAELAQMRRVIRELQALQQDVAGRTPTLREKVAGAGFLAQFYNGVENILKRISSFHGVTPPDSARWHVALFERFCVTATSPAAQELPTLFDNDLAEDMAKYRGFRHFARANYGVELNWSLMAQGIALVHDTFVQFEKQVLRYLETVSG
jgi:hypothetical protein